MKKTEKAITMISLVVTIAVLIILATVTVYEGRELIISTRLQTMNTNMLLIQAKTKQLAEQAKFNNDKSNYRGTKISDISDNSAVNELIAKNIVSKDDPYYLINQIDLNNMGLEKIDAEDGFLVNYDTEEIIYVKGFKIDNAVYYKLSEMRDIET